jgi:hypothetical protein
MLANKFKIILREVQKIHDYRAEQLPLERLVLEDKQHHTVHILQTEYLLK